MIQFTSQTNDNDSPGYAKVFSIVVLQDQNDPISVNYLMRRDANDGRFTTSRLTRSA